MPRVHLALPDHFLFATALEVRVSDLNYGGHVGNDRMLTLMQEARIHFYRHLGFEGEMKLTETIGQIITDVVVIYKSEAFLGDKLRFEIAATDFNKYGFDLVYRVTNSQSGKEVALGKTGIVCFDYKRRKMVAIPPSVSEKFLNQAQGHR